MKRAVEWAFVATPAVVIFGLTWSDIGFWNAVLAYSLAVVVAGLAIIGMDLIR